MMIKKELPRDATKCPTKHTNAYKTSFASIFCPDCSHNVTPNKPKFVRQAKLPQRAYAKSLEEILASYKKKGEEEYA